MEIITKKDLAKVVAEALGCRRNTALQMVVKKALHEPLSAEI